MIDLAETVNLMLSNDFKARFRAEYYQLATRYEKLSNLLDKYDNGTLDFVPNSSFELLHDQKVVMKEYIKILEKRAMLEQIDL